MTSAPFSDSDALDRFLEAIAPNLAIQIDPIFCFLAVRQADQFQVVQSRILVGYGEDRAEEFVSKNIRAGCYRLSAFGLQLEPFIRSFLSGYLTTPTGLLRTKPPSSESYLRLYPKIPTREHTQFELLELVRTQHPMLLGRPLSLWWEQNEWGAAVFNADGAVKQTTAQQLVQLTTRGEIWAVDQTLMWIHKGQKMIGYFEDMFLSRLKNYLEYCRDKLGVTSDVTVEVGFTGIRGYSVVLPPPPPGYMRFETIGGIASNEDIFETIRTVPLDADPLTVLYPFFVKAWGKFGLPRADYLPVPTATR